MGDLALFGVLGVPALAAVLLGLLPGYHLEARLNVLAALLSFLSALVFLISRPAPGPFILVDDFNIYLIVLNSFVGFTTSVYSATYIDHELEIGRLTPAYLRFYHAMYQAMLGAMNLALLANNIGIELPEEPAHLRSNWQSYSVGLPAHCDQRTVMQAMLDAGIATQSLSGRTTSGKRLDAGGF